MKYNGFKEWIDKNPLGSFLSQMQLGNMETAWDAAYKQAIYDAVEEAKSLIKYYKEELEDDCVNSDECLVACRALKINISRLKYKLKTIESKG